MGREYNSLVPELYIARKKGDNNLNKVKITSSRDSYDFFRKLFNEDTLSVNESFIAVFLNISNNTIAWTKISSGGVSSTVVDHKMILKIAIGTLSSAIIIAHNHPSGNIKPSESDKLITNKIKSVCKNIDINLLDHLILSEEGYYSFADSNLL
jgi:DNA repair protein RadC